MKKLRILWLLVFSLLIIDAAFVRATDEITEIQGARYQVTEVAETNELPFGVRQTRNIAQTSTSLSGYDADGLGGGNAEVVPGQFYQQQVNVLEVPSSDTVRVTTWANLNGNRWTLTSVRAMISDYEAKNTGWKVLAAINADFFDISGTGNLPYQTSGATVSAGEFFKTTTGKLVGFRNDGSADSIVGNEKVERTPNMILSVYNEKGEIISEFPIEKINEAPSSGETAIYYANYNDQHNIVPIAVEPGNAKAYFVETAEYAIPNNTKDFYGRGMISSLTLSALLNKGQFGIITNNAEVENALAVGVRIRCQYEYLGAYAGINDISGCSTTILENSTIPESSLSDGNLTNRAPRTVVGRKEDGTIVMMVIDGRQATKGMYGADITEIAAAMRAYGAVEAYNLDGGGSSTMVIRKGGEFVVLNSPSDGRERTDANCLLVVVKDPIINVGFTDVTQTSFTVSASVTDDKGYDIQELYVKVNNQMVSMADGAVHLDNLTSNTKYLCEFYYRTEENNFNPILQTASKTTLKKVPEFIRLDIVETPETFIVSLVYQDPDGASSIASGTVKMNGKQTYAYGGVATMTKSKFGYDIASITVVYIVNINDGKPYTEEIKDAAYQLKISAVVPIYDLYTAQNNIISDIYK